MRDVPQPIQSPFLPKAHFQATTMTQPTLDSSTPTTTNPAATPPEAPPSFVKLAMRNMVKKGGKSLYHFALTTVGLLGLLVGLAYLTR